MNPFCDIDFDGSPECLRGLFRLIAEELGHNQADAALAVERLESEQMLEQITNSRAYDADVSAMFKTELRDRLALLEEIAEEIPIVGTVEIDESPGPQLVWVNPGICKQRPGERYFRVHAKVV